MQSSKESDLEKGEAVYLNTLLHKAQHYEETNEFALAIEAYQEYVSLYNKNPFVYAHMGECYRFSDDLDQAVLSLQTAVELNPEYGWAYAMLGETFYVLDDYAAAISALQKAIANKMDDAHIYYVIGNAYCALDEADEGIFYFDQAIGLDPDNEWFFIQRGMALISLNRLSECEQDLNKAIELVPNHAYPYYYLGLLKETESKIEEAISAFSQCILLEQDLFYGRRKRGALYLDQGEYELALDDFLILKQLLPENYDVEVQLGETYFRMGRKAEAITAFKKAVKLKGQIEEPDPLLYNSIGVGYFELGYYDQAIRYYKQALKIAPTNAEILANHANVLLSTGNLKKALTTINQALEYAEEPIASMIVIRAEIYREMKEIGNALVDFDEAINLRPDYGWAIAHRALTLAQHKRNPEEVQAAFEGFNHAFEIEPQNIWALYQRGCLHKDLGEFDLALSDFRAVLDMDPLYSYAIRDVADILIKQKKYSEAENCINSFLEKIGDDTDALDTIGSYCQSTGYYDQAIVCYERIWDGYRETSEALLELAKTYKNAFKLDKAMEAINRFIEFNPKHFEGYVYRAMIFRNLRQFEKAIEEFSTSFKLKKNEGWVYANRGLAYHCLNQHDQALGDYQKALTLGYQNDWIYCRLADHYLNLNQLQEAQKWIEKVLTENPSDWNALTSLALIAKVNNQATEYSNNCAKALIMAEEEALKPTWNTRLQFNFVQLLLIKGDKERALELITGALSTRPPLFVVQEALYENLGLLTQLTPNLAGLDEAKELLQKHLAVT